MLNQKLENSLNLALSATNEERAKSLELDVGFHPIEKEWELIVKYTGDLTEIRELGVQIVELMNGYAIVTVKESLIEALTEFAQIEYIEKPKRLFFEQVEEKFVSCITPVQIPPLDLTGKGVLAAVIDSGIDYQSAVFRKENGLTRIKYLWDQSVEGNPPKGYQSGAEYSEREINEALLSGNVIPTRDSSGHGTAVAGVFAGNALAYQGVAYESELIVVKLGIPRENDFPRTTELMQGIDYVVKKAIELGQPVAINLSFGNTYGAHEPYN